MPSLHNAQVEVAHSTARFKALACGRRWGKTRLGTALCIAVAAKGGRAWWVAPSYKMAHVGWRGIKRIAQQIPNTNIHEVEKLVTLPTGGEIQVRSADDPNSLRGEGLDFVVMDECAFMKEDAWNEALRPALSDRKGGALFISTPKGRNWFWRMWMNDAEDVHSWRFPTSSNPFIDGKEIEAAKRGLPERIFMQEYEAQFLEDAGGVFRRVMEAAKAPELQSPIPGGQYVIGVDWARTNDATVFCVMDSNAKRQVYLDRMTNIDYETQRRRLLALFERFKPSTIMAEYNSMGGPMVERLQNDGLPVQAFNTTNATKQQIIDRLAMAFERGSIEILPDPHQIGELQAYEQERLPSGLIRYSAPDGMHDDTVMALALAWYVSESGGWDVF